MEERRLALEMELMDAEDRQREFEAEVRRLGARVLPVLGEELATQRDGFGKARR